jgi:hypothetical protein
MSDSFHALQSILGTDKKNPLFSVYRDPDKSELHVYYGLELLEVVPDDKQSPRFKLMVAQLYNAGVKGVTLSEVFSVDRKVMRQWGRALKSGDPQTLVNALKGRGPRKLTPEVKAYVKMRFPIAYAEDKRTYSAQLRQEILEVFQLKISGETLRPYFNKLKELNGIATRASRTKDPPSEQGPEQPAATAEINDSDPADQASAKKGDLAV